MLSLPLLLLSLVHLTAAKLSTGSFHKDTSFSYLDKFCFDSRGGTLTVNLDLAPASDPNQYVLFFDDGARHWPAVYTSEQSCEWKSDQTDYRYPISQTDGFHHTFTVEGARPRWWYIAVANCATGEIAIDEYSIKYVNDGGLLTHHFGADADGILLEYIVYFMLSIALFTAMAVYYATLQSSPNRHALGVVVWLMTVVGVHSLSLLLYLSHNAKFARDGQGSELLQGLGFAVQLGAEVSFLALLLFLSKGWKITQPQLTSHFPLAVAIGTVATVYFSMMIWSQVGADAARTLYIFESTPGYMIIVVRMFTMVWFLTNLFQTAKFCMQEQKRAFFIRLGMFGSVYFLSMPVVVLIAHFLGDWQRAKIVLGIELGVTFVSQGLLWAVFGPFLNSSFGAVLLEDDHLQAVKVGMELNSENSASNSNERVSDLIQV